MDLTDRLVRIAETYFTAVRDARRLGAATPERSYYPAVAELLNSVGALLKPKVIAVAELGNTGAGHPDFGLFTSTQLQKGVPRQGQPPERGVVELKSVAGSAWPTADTKQIGRYFGAYSLLLVSNLRDVLIVGEGPGRGAAKRESFRLAHSESEFWQLVSTPKKSAERVGRAFCEYLKRALTQTVPLREPKDVAWFLASYARDALQRVDDAGDLPALANVKSSLEEALGVTFDTDKGKHFFRSTLVQTLFYGVFSSWVLWARDRKRKNGRFDWQKAIWYLNVPFVSALFQQIASPKHLKSLGLVELLDWTEATLNRVDVAAFMQKFNDADAVQFFYEPFLEAFDPKLRKELGVWYTPNEVVTYMVARVDRALREDLGVKDGLASERVVVLDPCCGTGAYVAAVLRRIDRTLADKGFGALKAQMVKKAALERIVGFEIMPAPFVVAHLQVGSVLQQLGAQLTNGERAGVYLTNALTGWEPKTNKPLPFPELEEERSRADELKQTAPILVVLGNPPYNGYAGVTIGEERELSKAYRTTKRVRRPEGQGLNDLYVRFFRMAERRIVETTGQGVVCFISNYSWLDGLSFTGMRERYLDAFDIVRIDCLNGDKYKTGKTTPDGKPDPSIFSTEHNREGIQVGTAIATLVRKPDHTPAKTVGFRHLWGTGKQRELLGTTETAAAALYPPVTPPLDLGLPFVDAAADDGYFNWPKLPELLPVSFPGVTTSRDDFLVGIDRDALERRISDYFDPRVAHEEMRARYPSVTSASARYDPRAIRDTLLKRGILRENIVRYAYRPFDVRWLYWEPETKLLDEKRKEYWPHVMAGNFFIEARKKEPKEDFSRGTVTGGLSDNFGSGHSTFFPLALNDGHGSLGRMNLPQSLAAFLSARDMVPETIFRHVVATLHAPTYRRENVGALRMDWPRVPLPGDAKTLSTSAALGRTLAAFLDPETPAPGVSMGALRPGLKTLGLPAKRGSKNLDLDDLALTAGWGSTQTANSKGTIVMPGRGLVAERAYTNVEKAALAAEGKALGLTLDEVLLLLGGTTLDVHLNTDAWWSNVPKGVWDYALGGYQVIKKWLSYRERSVLGRGLKPEEAAYVSQMVRRIAAILLMGPALDANYAAAKANAIAWKDGPPAEASSA
ncbi:MAG: type ISP restriction/modification enzyme [Hyphomicrobiaceae bacterium]